MSDPGHEASRSSISQLSLALIGAAIVLALVAVGIYTWRSLGPVDMGASGYIAMILGVIGTVALGVGLMALVFFSHRSGYDDQAGGRNRGTRDGG